MPTIHQLMHARTKTTFTVLREHQETLISVLEPFLFDPTVGWDRQGRAQRGDSDGSSYQQQRPNPYGYSLELPRSTYGLCGFLGLN